MIKDHFLRFTYIFLFLGNSLCNAAATPNLSSQSEIFFPLEDAIEDPAKAPTATVENPANPPSTQPPVTATPPLKAQEIQITQAAIPSAPTPAIQPPAPAAPLAAQPVPEVKNNAPQQAAPNVTSDPPQGSTGIRTPLTGQQLISVNYNNIGMIEFIRFISRITGKNFIFDQNDLQFNVTIVSEEPTTVDNIMTALLQELRIHNLTLLEQGNNLIIHRNASVNAISTVVDSNAPTKKTSEIVTKVFRLNALDAEKAAAIAKPLVSASAIIEVIKETNNLIITDLVANIDQLTRLFNSLDAPQSGLVVGQYIVKNAYIDNLVQMAQQLLLPIAKDQTLTLVPHNAARSIFIVSTPYLVERALTILQYLDQTEGTTQILNPAEARYQARKAAAGQWQIDEDGIWRYRTNVPGEAAPPEGAWVIDADGNWVFKAGATPSTVTRQPKGHWMKDDEGNWVYELEPGGSIIAEKIRRPVIEAELPVGHIERTKFYIHKLRYRKAEDVSIALGKIATSLEKTGKSNADLVETIYSIQPIESSNALVASGTVEVLTKIKELIEQIDRPLRQVLIEMLILDATLADTLDFSVNPVAAFGGGPSAGAEGFITGAPNFPSGQPTPPPPTTFLNDFTAASQCNTPDTICSIANIIQPSGFTWGIIGKAVNFCGMRFNTLGALIRAIHTNSRINIVMNPKLLTEDNAPAEVFVGSNTPYPVQSITNDNGNIVTANFEYRDVGTLLRVTPLIGDNDMITMEIEEERSVITQPLATLGSSIVGPTTSKSRTATKVHLPNGYFCIISGALEDIDSRSRTQVPCLGGIPILGSLFSDKARQDARRNLLIFIRPKIVDSIEEIQNATKHQQDIWHEKQYFKKDWKYETQEALDFLNIRNSNPEEDPHVWNECLP